MSRCSSARSRIGSPLSPQRAVNHKPDRANWIWSLDGHQARLPGLTRPAVISGSASGPSTGPCAVQNPVRRLDLLP